MASEIHQWHLKLTLHIKQGFTFGINLVSITVCGKISGHNVKTLTLAFFTLPLPFSFDDASKS